MTRGSRGVALVETALSVSVSLLIVLGAAQMAILGYMQLSADGAAFVAAHAAASNPSGNAVTAAQDVFNEFPASDFSTPSPPPNFDPALVTSAVAGFSLLPGFASTYAINGKAIEYQAPGAANGASAYAFDSNGTYLLNYCAPPGTSCTFPSSYSIYLLGGADIDMSGNGNNGPFKQWRCRQKIYARLAQSFKSGTPGGGYSSIPSNLDVNNKSSDENSVYGWDGGASCK